MNTGNVINSSCLILLLHHCNPIMLELKVVLHEYNMNNHRAEMFVTEIAGVFSGVEN